MGFRNFLVSIIKSIITLVVVTLIFSTITLNFPDLIKNFFGDIFTYASPDAQRQAINNLAETCSSLDKGNNAAAISQICANASLLDSMRKNCRNYNSLKEKGIKAEDEEKLSETCSQLESGELEKACNEMQKNHLLPDFNKIGALCKDYKAGNLSDNEFFFNVISGAIPGNMELPNISNIAALEKYNQLMSYLNGNKIIYFIILLGLFIVLYLLIKDAELFFIILSQISFSIGIFIMLPYTAIIAYGRFAGFDTTSILGSLFGAGNIFDFKSIASVVLLLFLRTYNGLIITLGIVFLVIGIVGKFYNWRLKKRGLKETKRGNKIREAKDKSFEEDREREKSTKEILDELEETQKKKSKGKRGIKI